LDAEVTNVSPNGVWLLLDGRELFASFRDFPWLADATIEQLTAVERPSRHHLYWPALDVDLAVESLHHPERYPLLSRVRSNKRLQLARAQPASRKGQRPRARPRS
jgi:hypothetical protein